MTLSDLVVLVMEVMSRTTHSDMLVLAAGGDDGDGEAEVAEVLQLCGGGGHLYKPQCGQWTAGLSRSVSVCSDIWGINDPNDH